MRIWIESWISERSLRQMFQVNDRGSLDHVSGLIETDRALATRSLEFCDT